MKKILLFLSLLILTSVSALAQQFDLKPAPQADSPIKIELGKIEFSKMTEWKNKEYYTLNAPYTLENVSGKDIRGYKIFVSNDNNPKSGAGAAFTARTEQEFFKPGTKIEKSHGGDNFPKINAYTITVTFVEFTDGTTWKMSSAKADNK